MPEAPAELKYETKTVKTTRGMEGRSRTRWEKEGWEFVEQSQGAVQSTLVFRRPAPKKPWLIIGVAAGLFAVALAGIIALGALNDRHNAEQAAETSPRASQKPTPSHSHTPAALETPVQDVATASDAEALQLFHDFVDERRSAGVLFAKGVTGMTLENRVLRVTFDPAAAGVSQELWDQTNPFKDNMADFMITPMAFNDETGPRLRAAVDSVETFRADGTPLGTRTTQWVIDVNDLG